MVLFEMEKYYEPDHKRMRFTKIEQIYQHLDGDNLPQQNPEQRHVLEEIQPDSTKNPDPEPTEPVFDEGPVYGETFYSPDDVHPPENEAEEPIPPGHIQIVRPQQVAVVEEHVPKFDETMSYICHICNGCFHKKTNLQRHWKQYHGLSSAEVDSISATICAKDRTELDRVHELTVKQKCRFCPKLFYGEDDIWAKEKREAHENQHHSAQVRGGKSSSRYQCPICGSDFSARGMYESHIRANHHLYSQRILRPTDMGFSDESGNQPNPTSTTTPSGRSAVKCAYCPRLFTDQDRANRHQQLVHLLRPGVPRLSNDGRKTLDYPCQFCKRSFATEGAANSHEAIDHRDEQSQLILEKIRKQETYNCDICKLYKTPKEENLRRHYRIVHKLVEFQIEEKMQNSQKNAVKAEESAPLEVRERVWCTNNEPSIEEIAAAVDINGHDTPYVCEICKTNRSFRTEHGYNMHRYKEHGIKSVKQETKREIKQLYCLFCEDFFATEVERWKHHNQAHECFKNKAYECGMCDAIYAAGRELKSHWKNVHRLKEELVSKINLTDHEVKGKTKLDRAKKGIRRTINATY